MGTTRIKVVDLSSEQEEVKTSRKHADKIKVAKEPKEPKEPEVVASDKEGKIEGQDQEVQGRTLQDNKVKAKSASKPKKQKHHLGKKYQAAAKQVDPKQSYKIDEALSLVKATSYVKFDPTVEVHLNVVDKSVRGKVSFPHSIGEAKKAKRYLVFSDKRSTINDKQIIWADEKSIPDLESGKLKPSRDFDAVITSPKYMPHLAKVAKILGPKGMMPNPKNGTITDDIEKILQTSTDDTTVEFRTDPTAAILHTKIGKLSFGEEKLGENFKALTTSIGQTKIKKVTISATMGPGIKIDIATLGK